MNEPTCNAEHAWGVSDGDPPHSDDTVCSRAHTASPRVAWAPRSIATSEPVPPAARTGAAGPRFGVGGGALPRVYPGHQRHVGEADHTPDEVQQQVGAPPLPRAVTARVRNRSRAAASATERALTRRARTAWLLTVGCSLFGLCAMAWGLSNSG